MCASSTHTMFDVQNIYGTPQVPRKRTCIRPRRMTLIDLRNVPLAEEDAPHRKGSAGTIRSEGGLSHYSKSGIWHIHDSTDSLPSWRGSTMRTKHSSSGSVDGPSRFPKLEECAHFHYDLVDFGPLQAALCEDDRENFRHNEDDTGEYAVLVRVCCNNKAWTVRRTLSHFCSLDRQLHRCIFDRKFSQLPELHGANIDNKTSQEMEYLLHGYLKRFSELAGSMINCGSILNWLEMDNRGNRLLAVDDSGINTPAIAAAHAVKRYNAQAADEISLQVGDIVSVIDMPPAEDTIWWRGKRGFEVGFFPSECVEVIGDKVPPSMATRIASSASGTGQATLSPSATLAAARKPCEIEPSIDTAVMMRKHGKLLSFLRTFFTTRPARNQLKQSGIVKERVFGCDLGEHLLNSGHDVPLVLKSCTEVIERHGIVDGIYRLSGITSNIQKLRVAFDEDPVPELMDSAYLQDIHSISSLLKMYFRELPNPLLTYQLYDKFAEAVKDEDNKLLRIHDVVQQLPPPHYRTLEYLMRHLARVASHGHETGMHSKNLAIVWAPNLLRSKELEQGGGAAALQGVGIQAVVTECLICYSDILFSDKLPNYSSPHLQKSQKKPRPKSLAISTPTRLLSLEEARERAFIGSLAQSQRYIDVGGGPASLPSTYHTVIDLPGYRKKTGRETNKGKKSPVTGWKSIFSKPRSGSMKKSRKPSIHGTDIPDSSVQAKALTEEDVHNWKRRLRSAKSAESLLSMATSSRSSNGSHGLNFISTPDGSFRFKDEHLSPFHKRSLSSDASAIIHHHHHLQRDLQNNFTKEASVDVKNDNTSLDGCTDSDKQPESSSRQTFIRGDSTRKALHRRTPSAPNTPRLDRDHGGMARHTQKTSSQPGLDSLPGSPSSDNSMFSSPTTDGGLGIDIDAAIKARLQQMAVHSCRTGSGDISPLSVSKLSPNRGKENIRKGETETGTLTVELPASPGSLRRHPDTTPSMSKFFVSRYHDYAEILSDDEKDANDSSEPSSTTDMQELVEKLDSKLQSTAKFYLHSSSETDSQQSNTKLNEIGAKEVHTQVSSRNVEHLSANKHHRVSPPGTLIPHRRRECIPSDTTSAGASQQGEDAHSAVDFAELAGWVPRQRNSIVSPASHPSEGHSVPEGSFKNRQGSSIISGVGGNITKCLSVPSDIARSLENITASQCDLLSSVTISELSQSINSFCTSLQDDSPAREDSRWRRSTSLDSLENDSPMCRTLRAINAQMNSAFHQTDDSALTPDNEHYSEHAQESSLTPLHISEERLTPSKLQETHFPATLDTDTSMQERSGFNSSVVRLSHSHGKFIHPCPNSDTDDENEIVSHQFASGTPLHVAQLSKEQLSPQTAMLLSSSHYKGVEKSVSEDVRSQEQFLTSSVLQHEKTNSDRLTFLHSPSSSSSCSTGSSNSDEDSDGSFEIVHHAQPHDVQYAMRLRSGQRAAESLPNIMRSTGATCSVPVMKPSTTVQPLQYSECSSELPKFSQDDYLWKQSPLFGSKEKAIDSEIKSSDKENHERKYWKNKKRPLSMSLSSNNNIRNQWERPILNGNQASPSHQESKELDPGTTAGQEFQSFSQSQQNRDLVLPNQPFRPSPHGRTSDETESQLTPQLPSPSLPLHLMLYHPDEFQVPKSAFGMVSTPPPPEVHVNSDTVTEEKAIIKKTAFKKSPTETEISAHCSRHASQPQTSWQSLPRNASFTGNGVVPMSVTDQSSELGRISVDLRSKFSEFIEGQDASNKVIDMGGGWGTSSQAIEVEREKGMELGQSEIDAMEVDNLCNKLVDDLTQIHDKQSTVHSHAQGEGPCVAHLNTLQVDVVMKQQFEGSLSGDGDASLMQERIQRLNSFGEVQEEELQNALNAGKELLLAREPSAPIIISSAVISPTTSACSQSHKPTHERKLSASKIPRFNKWIDYKEEKVSSADSTQSSGINSIASNMPNPCFIAEVKTAVVQSKSKDSEQSKFRSSKIPLSQKIPSPTSSFHEPQQRFSKTDSSPSSHKHSFPVAHKTLQQTKSSHGLGPVPKARISLNKPDVAPPAEEVVEVTRPSVRKRASLSKGDKSVTKEDKTVIVKELKIDKGEAKLVIEKQPHLKKKIQTVHARKVPHPPRQIAEALDADSCDSPPAEHSSTGPSDMDHSGMSSQEDEVFSDESLGTRINRRERSFSSGTMCTKEQAHVSPNSPYSSEPSTDMESYNQIAASRSSLDDSALQLAAERHDTFVPDEMCGYNTGSLRTRRSLKMQSLMELFEKNSGSNSSEDSSDAKWARSSDSTSESTTLSAGSQEKEPDTDDDIFNSCSRLSLSNQARCSRSRERGGRGLNKVSPLGTPAYKGEKIVLKNRKPSPLGDASMEVQHKGIKASSGTGTGRPPRYRGGSAPRAYINSDSSTSESDSHQQIDIGSYLKEPTVHRPARTTVWEMQETNLPEVKSGDLMGSSEDKSVQRRESIKELRQMFEKGAQNKEEDRDSGSETTLCTQIRLSPRTRSVSPAADNQEVQTAVMGVMRHSLELSNSAAGIRQGETPLMAQPLRLGPKPFYGSKN